MGIQFTIYPIASLVRYTVEGVPADLEAGDFIAAVLAHRHFRRGFDFLGECPGTNNPDTAYPLALARAVRWMTAEIGSCRWAVVVSSPAEASVVQQSVELVPVKGVEVVTFLTQSAAFDWLAADRSPPASS